MTIFNQKRIPAFVAALVLTLGISAQSVYRVSVSGAGNKTGTSWADAMNDSAFRIAVRNAVSGDTFLVQEGTYLPDADRDSSFRLTGGIKLIGGFSSTDTTWAGRNWQKNQTILSGDIGSAGTHTDNNYHVVYCAYVDTNTVVDGFYIKYGRADGSGSNRDNGGGILNVGTGSGGLSGMQVWHCVFMDNYATTNGGGFCDLGTTDGQVYSLISGCVFQNNTSGSGGGICMRADGGSNNGIARGEISNCVFVENDATSRGGGMYLRGVQGTIYVTNITSTQNTSPTSFGGQNGSTLYARSGVIYLRNSVTANNPGTDVSRDNAATLYVQQMVYEGGYFGGSNIINSNPFFVDSANYTGTDGLWATADDGLRPKMAAPMLGNGNDAYLFAYLSQDLAGMPRMQQGRVDLGAYETEVPCPELNVTSLHVNYCLGDTITFHSSAKWGGPNGNYSLTWKASGSTVFSGDSICKLNNLYTNDTVYVTMSNTVACNYPNNPKSNGVIVRVDYPYSPSIGGTSCQYGTLSMTPYAPTAKLDWMVGSTVMETFYRHSLGYGMRAAGDTFGNAGTDSFYLSSPRGISVDQWGNTYVVDRNNARVMMWMPGYPWGETKAGDKNGTKGNADYQLNVPVGIYVDGRGSVYVADSGANRIQRWDYGKTTGLTLAGDPAGSSGTDSSKLSGPTGVFALANGTLYIADYNNNRVQKWEPGMSYGTTVAGNAGGSSGSDSSKLSGPTNVWVNEAGDIYVSDSKNHRIQKWAAGAGYGVTVAGTGTSGSDSVSLNTPTDFKVDKMGTIYVVDQGNHRVQKFFTGNNWAQTVAGAQNSSSGSDSSKLNMPWAVVVDYAGEVYVSDQANNRVMLWQQLFDQNDYVPDSTGDYSVLMTTTYGCGTTSNTATINPAYVPSITVTPSAASICVGDGVNFTATTSNGGSNPVFKWTKNGTVVGSNDSTYTDNGLNDGDTVTCILTSNVNCATPVSVTASPTIMAVYQIPVGSITAGGATTICGGDSVILTAGTNPAWTYQWYIGGQPINGASDSTYTAIVAGDYTVNVTTPGGCDSMSVATTIVVKTGVNANVTPGGNTTFCQGDSVVLSGNSGNNYSYQWWMNGAAINGATSMNYTANATGDYAVTVTDSTACPVTSSPVSVTVNVLPSSVITNGGNTAFCPGDSTTLWVPTSGSYQWYWNGSAINGATDSLYMAKDSGSYTAMVTDANNCSSTSATAVSISLHPVPVASINAAATAVCQGDSTQLAATTGNGYTYQWWMNGTAVNGATADIYYASAAGDYQVQVTNSNGCMDVSAATTISVNALPTAATNAAGNTTVCQGDSVQLDASTGAGLTYAWLLNGNTINAATGSTYYASASGNYTVQVTNSNNCSAVSSGVTVTVNPLPAAGIAPNGNTTFCQGGSVVLDAPGNMTGYVWYLNGSAINGATNASHTAATGGDYTVMVTDANGCSATSAATTITVNALPAATIAVTNNPVCQGDSAKLDAGSSAGLTFEWYLNGNPVSGASGAIYYATASGSYTVKVTNANTCSAASAASSITVNPLPATPVITKTGNTLSSATAAGYQWYRNGVAIPAAISQTYNVTQHGSYTVTITDANGCKNTSAATGMNVGMSTTAGPEISIAPNPSNGHFVLSASGLQGNTLVQVFDMAGKCIATHTLLNGSTPIDLGTRAAGMYVLHISNGLHSSKHRIVIQ